MKYCSSILLFLTLTTACRQQSKVSPVHREIVDAVFGSGHIENKEQYTVMANTDGYLKAVYVTEGDTVKPGRQLFSINNDVQQTQVSSARTNLEFAQTNTSSSSPQIEQLKIQIGQLREKLDVDSLNYRRYERLSATQAASRTDFENARLQFQASQSNLAVLRKNLADLQHNLTQNVENARSQLQIQQQNNNYYNLASRASGIVLSVNKKAGDYIRKGDAIAQIGAGTPLIKILIAEDDIRRVQTGQTALVSLNSDKNKIYKATITRLYPAFNATEQSFTVEAAFTEQPELLINGTQLQANIIIEDKKNALVIPSYFLLNGDSVLLDSKKEKIPVKTGIRTLEWTEITGGLSEQDRLVLPK